ncbi:flagellar hook capping FlgD N-terminal domain-containing protein [Meridianimarinicoccus aquatilis]|uniref:Basal-body rod modification protein FlgD n=1 Tax=Meridianimarinicoccus aquatilis TaxID=2552766 RepID=A0A4R6AKW9_9RHOB|nr:flagellar hook capping FlgD N-terminal domain-containing protein [Fluviibacterium aquatile]TDL84931.1 flagellar basal body rod modification protein [Fluviibacterium aquatile]TDL87019.1 flagellar basal body rod modification protein [Fluviibacterium aquatile]
MEISSTTTAATQSTTTSATDNSSESALSSDFETFLKMLTTQMQNQDPLNPIESSDFAVQLATFSGVEQQVQTNNLLRGLGADSSLGGLSQHASWVGMDARVDGPIYFGGSPVDVYYDLPLDAASAELIVSGPSGQELHRSSISGAGPLAWDGVSPTGTQLLAGSYNLSIETRTLSGQSETLPVSSYARITEVQSGTDGPLVVLDSGEIVSTSGITALRNGS